MYVPVVFLSRNESVQVFFLIVCLYTYCKWRSGECWDPINRYLCCPKPGPGFLMSYVVVFLYSVETIVWFVDIGGIDDHCCSTFFP